MVFMQVPQIPMRFDLLCMLRFNSNLGGNFASKSNYFSCVFRSWNLQTAQCSNIGKIQIIVLVEMVFREFM